jgi:hypothetical protein
MRRLGQSSSSVHQQRTGALAPRLVGRTSLSLAGAVLLSLLLAGQSLAATWSVKPLTSSGNAWAGGLVTLGSSTAVAVYEDSGAVFVRRSTNSGATWKAPLRLAASVGTPAIAGRGTDVDVVWMKSTSITTSVIHYARSTNSGDTFRASVRLSPKTAFAYYLSVARGPNGRVAAAWVEGTGSGTRVRIRVSTDGGASFAKAKTLATSSGMSRLAVAVGKGAIYAAYTDATGLRVRRSTNSGSTWSSARLIDSVDAGHFGDPSITAVGGAAYVAYTALAGLDVWARYSRTTDKGATWTSPANLSPRSGPRSLQPSISLQGGVVRVVFGRDLDPDGLTGAAFYRQSSNGTSWTAAEMVSVPTITPTAWPVGVGYSGKVIVLYIGLSPAEPVWDSDVWVGIR